MRERERESHRQSEERNYAPCILFSSIKPTASGISSRTEKYAIVLARTLRVCGQRERIGDIFLNKRPAQSLSLSVSLMGNVACGGAGSSATTSDGREEASAAADKIQRDLLEKRRRSAEEHKGKGEEVGEDAMRLPRSTQDDQGRFLLVKEHFPGARDAVGLRDVWRWRRNVVKTPRCTEEDLKHLPLLQLDKVRINIMSLSCVPSSDPMQIRERERERSD